MNSKLEFVKETLKNKGYKYTSQRAEVFEVFLNNKDKHLSTEEVFEILSKVNKEIGIATVYRNVQLFEELGILDKITFDDGIGRYELRSENEDHYHHHLICLKCNKVLEVKIDLLDDLEEEIEKAEDFQIVDHNLKFYGYCSQCKNNVKGEMKWEMKIK